MVLLALAALLPVGMLVGTEQVAAASGTAGSGAFSQKKTVTREFADDDSTEVVDSRDVTVKVDHTLNLRGRERVQVSWSGARPSAGRAANPYGENGMSQEYPVVVLQCRGREGADLPAGKKLSPQTCWTSTQQQRSQSSSDRTAIWRHDLYAKDADRGQVSGVETLPAGCPNVSEGESTHVTPFVTAAGKTFNACSSETMPPEAAIGAAFPPAEVAAFTALDGRGEVSFEVRSATENESLGCSDTTPCSLVVIPIMGLSCDGPDDECRASGRMRAGSNNFANEGVDAAVSPLYWWSESNWRNRVTVPLTFGLPPDACDVLDSRAPTAIYGSELMSQAALQWAPAYCLRKDRFKFQHNRLGDEPAFALVEKGDAPAAFVSGDREQSTEVRIGYAPTAVTGFAVAYIVDEPDNAGERRQLKLTPRLVAKLLTQSYTGSARGQGHPGMGKNPQSINVDPEFIALNPGLDRITREAAATVLSLSESSDVISALTSYIANDAEASAFVKGAKDPWGMVVNPSYKDVALPVDDFPLLDQYQPPSAQECYRQNPAPYFGQLAAPVSSLRKVAEAVLDAWPNVQTKCDRASTSDPFKVGRIDRQGVGTRFMLGIVSLGDASRFGLRTAALRTSRSTFVAPTEASITAAVKTAKKVSVDKAFTLTQKRLSKVPAAYPGTMIVYTTARLSGLDKADAKNISSFIRIATTEGQNPGSGNGALPDGFLPIRSSGATSALYKQAQQVAKLVAQQKGPKAPGATPTTSAPTTAAPVTDTGAPVQDVPVDEEPATKPTTADETVTAEVVATSANKSGQAQAFLPVLLALLLAAGVAGPGTRLVSAWRRRR